MAAVGLDLGRGRGSHTLQVRATDREGELQTEDRAEPFPNGSSGWQSIVVTVGA